MSYEIPQQLEYEEKIIFNLNFRQLAYLLCFGLPMLLIFFKTGWNIYIRSLLTGILGCLASGCMFLNLEYHLRGWIGWYRFRIINEKPKLVQFVGVKEIKDNLIITQDGRTLAVLKVEPLNFGIKPSGTQEAIIGSFQKFLNSLDFPVQIIMNTESLNLDDYFKEIKQKVEANGQFKDLFNKYKNHLNHIISKNDILNRKFYLIIQQKHDIGIQVQLCAKKLETIGLRSVRLTNTQMTALLSKFFTGNEGALYPKQIENNPSYIKIGEVFNKILYAHGYPRSVEMGFLDKIVSLLGDFDLSLHIEPYDIETMMIFLNRELQKQRADLYAAQTKGILNPSLEIKYADTKAILENLQKGKEKLFNVSLYINCRAVSKETLELLAKKIESELNSLLIIPKHPFFRMAEAFQSCAPLAYNALKMKRNVPTDALSAFFPFTSSFLQADRTGIWFGLNKNNIPIVKDIFKLSNPNGFCLASSGSGKSYMAKLMIARHLMHGTKVMVIDPQGEYSPLVKQFNGQRIDLSRTSNTIINPLDLMGHDYQEKRLALMDLMPIMLGELSEVQRSFIDRALTGAYEECGIHEDPSTWNNKPPILEDVVRMLQRMERKASQIERLTIQSLINRLSLYVDGVFSFLNKQTHIDFSNRFVCFDIGNLPKQVKPTVMFLVLDYVYMKMKQDLERKILVIDEAWSLLSRTEDASYIFEIVKTCRKFNLALFLINQEVEGMLASEAGKSVLANSSYTILMRQKPAVIQSIQKTFYLSEHERMFLLTAAVGEGILLMDDEHSEIKIVASSEEHKYITTKPDELLEQGTSKKLSPKIQIRKQKFVKVTVDPDKRFYKQDLLSTHDRSYLLRKGYKEHSQLNIHGKKELYFLKPRRLESLGHFFLTYDIAEYLKQFTDKVQIYESVKPDVVFEVNGMRYAIEVETGKVLSKDKRKFSTKVKNLKQEFGDNWFFVVTDKNLVKTYELYGKTFTKRNITKKLQDFVRVR